jgi:hypothetical protein
MQTLDTLNTATRTSMPPVSSVSNAMRARRWAMIAAPTVAGLCALVGVIADPLPPATGRRLIEAYTNNPGRLNFKSLGYHFAYALWLATVFPLVGLVRRKGSWLANVAGVLAFLGISSIPGFLVTDWIQSAQGQVVGIDAALEIEKVAQSFWGFAVMAAPGMAGLALALPLATIAAWRAGILAWWGAAAATVGIAAILLGGFQLPGNVVLALAFVVLSFALARITSEPRPASEGASR